MEFIFWIVAASICLISWVIWHAVKILKPTAGKFEGVIGIGLFFTLILFLFGLYTHSTPHYGVIDPMIEPCYTPISYRYGIPLLLIHIISLIATFVLYFKEHKLPPLVLCCCIIMMTIGVIVNLCFLYHISNHDLSRIEFYGNAFMAIALLSIYPIALIVIAITIQIRLIKTRAEINKNFTFTNKYLDYLNQKLSATGNLPVLAMTLAMPVILIILLILILFGQEVEAIQKVFTDTATWRLSQEIHPPTVDDRHGHYLCTVAARGNPNLVKPICLGVRNNKTIIVNRQLQIANAFEQMMQEISPGFHKFVRTNYDKYGINLSKRINTEIASNLTYIVMKPAEWLFLIVLYFYYLKPEEVISRQYERRENRKL